MCMIRLNIGDSIFIKQVPQILNQDGFPSPLKLYRCPAVTPNTFKSSDVEQICSIPLKIVSQKNVSDGVIFEFTNDMFPEQFWNIKQKSDGIFVLCPALYDTESNYIVEVYNHNISDLDVIPDKFKKLKINMSLIPKQTTNIVLQNVVSDKLIGIEKNNTSNQSRSFSKCW